MRNKFVEFLWVVILFVMLFSALKKKQIRKQSFQKSNKRLCMDYKVYEVKNIKNIAR